MMLDHLCVVCGAPYAVVRADYPLCEEHYTEVRKEDERRRALDADLERRSMQAKFAREYPNIPIKTRR